MSPLRISLAGAIAGAVMAVPASAPAQSLPTYAIALFSYGYAPKPIVLQSGAPVRLVFTNRSGSGHDFTAKSFFANARIIAGDVRDGEVGMGPGMSKTVDLVPGRGRYKAHCGHFGHALLGMKVDIIVN